MMALKKKPDTRGLAPYLLRIHIILLHTSHTFAKFRITEVQSPSTAKINLPRYLKDVTISRGCP